MTSAGASGEPADPAVHGDGMSCPELPVNLPASSAEVKVGQCAWALAACSTLSRSEQSQ